MERAVAAALRQRASALVADDVRSAFALLERARAAGLGSLTVLVEAREPELPVVPKEQLLSSSVPAVTPEGFGYDPQRGELWFAGETAEAVLLELEAAGARSPPSSTSSAPARRRRSRPTRIRQSRIHGSPPRGGRSSTCALVSMSTRAGSKRRSRARADVGGAKSGELAAELRRRRRRGRAATRAVRARPAREHDRRRAREARGGGRRGSTPARAGRRGACRGRRPRGARREARAARAAARSARSCESAGEGGVRGREGAAGRAVDAARGSRSLPRGAREAEARPHRRDDDNEGPHCVGLTGRRFSCRRRPSLFPAARDGCA